MKSKRVRLSAVFLLIIIMAVGCGEKSGSKYQSKGEWSLYDTNYVFAIEVDDFDGDIYQAGKYDFKLTSADASDAGLFDIYTSTELITDSSDLTENMLVGIVGGMELFTLTMKLETGTYVYVIPYQGAAYEQHGILSINKYE